MVRDDQHLLAHRSPGGENASFDSVMIALVISATSAGYVFAFPALIALRRKYPGAPRPNRVPGGITGVPVLGGQPSLGARADERLNGDARVEVGIGDQFTSRRHVLTACFCVTLLR